MKKQKKKEIRKPPEKKVLVVIFTAILCFVLAVIGWVLGWYKTPIIQKNITDTTEEVATNTNVTVGKTDASQYITAAMGDSDEFYKPDENMKVILDFGKGNYDITSDVVKWSFSQPIVDMIKLGEEMGLTFQTARPAGFEPHERYEVYAPGDDPDVSIRQRVFLVADDGAYICYTVGSRIVEDNEGNVFYMTYPVTPEGETLTVAASSLPYYDGKTLIGGCPVETKYGESKITLVANPELKAAADETAEDEAEIDEILPGSIEGIQNSTGEEEDDNHDTEITETDPSQDPESDQRSDQEPEQE